MGTQKISTTTGEREHIKKDYFRGKGTQKKTTTTGERGHIKKDYYRGKGTVHIGLSKSNKATTCTIKPVTEGILYICNVCTSTACNVCMQSN